MGGPRVTENTKRLIIDTWLRLRKSGKQPTAKQVIAQCEIEIKRTGRRDILPQMRKVQNIIKEIKNENSTLIPSEKKNKSFGVFKP